MDWGRHLSNGRLNCGDKSKMMFALVSQENFSNFSVLSFFRSKEQSCTQLKAEWDGNAVPCYGENPLV